MKDKEVSFKFKTKDKTVDRYVYDEKATPKAIAGTRDFVKIEYSITP